MSNRVALSVSALLGAMAVGLGAFGTHGLKSLLQQNDMVSVWEKAVFYHMIHAVMLFVLAQGPTLRRGPWFSFLAGIVLFSGSLYLLAVTKLKGLGIITPFGGVSFIVGWLWLAAAPKAGKS